MTQIDTVTNTNQEELRTAPDAFYKELANINNSVGCTF
jgi:hypothetical protein